MILELLAKKYNIEPPTDPLMSDMCLHIDDVDLMTLYFTGIVSETVYTAKDVLLHLVTDEKYVYVLDVFLERYKDDILDYNTALNNAIILENVAIINSMMNKLEYSDLDLSRNSYSVVYKALKCQYRVYDPVLNKLKEYLSHVSDTDRSYLIFKDMIIERMLNYDAAAIASLSIKFLAVCNDQVLVKTLLIHCLKIVNSLLTTDEFAKLAEAMDGRIILQQYLA